MRVARLLLPGLAAILILAVWKAYAGQQCPDSTNKPSPKCQQPPRLAPPPSQPKGPPNPAPPLNPNYSPDINKSRPVEAADGTSHEVITDFTIPGTTGALTFTRTFSSGPVNGMDPWTSFLDKPQNVPTPFGQAPWNASTISWWHNFFAYVVADPQEGHTIVRTMDGEAFEYQTCGPSTDAGFCPYFSAYGAQRARLYWDGAKYALLLDTGEALVYGAPFTQWVNTYSTPRYFLTQVLDSHGAIVATVNYATSAPLAACTLSDAGATPAATPYIDNITSGDGTVLKFVYESLPGSSSFSPCVIQQINLVLNSGGQTPLVQYTYLGNEPGLIASAVWPAQPHNIVEQYTYGAGYPTISTEFDRTSDAGWLWTQQLFRQVHDALYGYVSDVYYSAGTGNGYFDAGHDTFSYSSSNVTCPNGSFPATTCCGANGPNQGPYPTVWVEMSTQAGNGSGAPVPLTHELDYSPSDAWGLHEPRIAREVDTCSSSFSAACANDAGIIPDWYCGINSDSNLGRTYVAFPNATQDKNGYWTVFTIRDAGNNSVPLALMENQEVQWGSATESPSFALESASYGYIYDAGGNWINLPWASTAVQLMSTQSTPSSSGGTATTQFTYDPQTHRLTSELLTGSTSLFASGSWSTVTQTRGVYYLSTPACAGGTQPDPLQRTLEVHGPCFDAGADCPSGVQMPITEYVYYETTARVTGCRTFNPASNQHRLCQVIRYPVNTGPGSCSSTGALTTQFLQYDERGNLLEMQDPNGVTTTLTYDSFSDRVASMVVNEGGVTGVTHTTSYTYDNGALYLVESPAANLDGGAGLTDVFCHRIGTQPGTCDTTKPWSPQVQWQAKASNPTGSQWTEAVVYTYWPDDTRQSSLYYENGPHGIKLRRTLYESADANRRPTWTGYGDGGGSFVATRGFDNNDNLAGAGLPYISPPSWCAAPQTGQGICALLTYNRANRLGVIDEFPDGGIGSRITTCLDRDDAGNLAQLSPGCSGGASGCAGFNSTTASSSCGDDTGGAALRYSWDDFGNIVAATLPWTATGGNPGTTRYQYDAMGNVLIRQTPAMAANSGEYMKFTYDALGRQTSVIDQSASNQTLSTMLYDVGGEGVDGGNCPGQTNILGRLSEVFDNFGWTYYSYDLEGRVAGEYRLENTDYQQCGALPMDSPHTVYTYSPNGVLTTVAMPYYSGYAGSLQTGKRLVTYTVGAIDRPTAVTATIFTDAGATNAALITNVAWEPYGGLRGYQINTFDGGSAAVEYMLGDNSANSPHQSSAGQPPATCDAMAFPVAAAGSSDYTGRIRTLAVSSGSFDPDNSTPPAADLYKVGYTWQADQLVEQDTCLLDGGIPRSELFAFDNMLRLTTASNPDPGDGGGGFLNRAYAFSARSNLTAETVDGCAEGMNYNSGALLDELVDAGGCYDGGVNILSYGYTFDSDGRVAARNLPQTALGAVTASATFTYGTSFDSTTDSVFHAVAVGNPAGSVSYNYYTDAFGRRRLKVYPTSVYDQYFHSLDSRLLADQGNSSLTPAQDTTYPEDDYIWLGGRPVAIVRGQFDNSFNRNSDFTASCPRNGEDAGCGVYFPVTDYLGKPVLMLDSARRVTGEADYDPLGYPNRVLLDGESAHNAFSNGSAWIMADVTQPSMSPSIQVSMRAQTDVLSYWESSGHCGGDGIELVDPVAGIKYGPVGGALGQFWTPWVTSTNNHLQVDYVQSPCQESYNGGSCRCFYHIREFGAIATALEYRRVQAGATPFWTPLRFPGQYFDPETDLAENLNRDYDAQIGRYLQPEPVLTVLPLYAEYVAKRYGSAPNAYAYALNNPVRFVDMYGLSITNNTDHWVWYKPENDSKDASGQLIDGENAVPVPPHTTIPNELDGFADPTLQPGYVYKTANHIDVTVSADGSVKLSGGSFFENAWQFFAGGWHDSDMARKHTNWHDLAVVANLGRGKRVCDDK